ncbi:MULTISPECIES: branched-chain amino acid ABC transporter ATP-binding protein/permease [unclassified Beijerinckia]|uniref:branched-chain amino acid ABC transporter ATP-binding protein/permease n=1 Tax=unclassified Beijerinckia TaxID=2638183 RepID=UPI000896434E|nr:MULTISPECIES: branched-chain amino acid ABC transporter ATP-binding protein/permease [unclassified Beijerinckia]MDH7799030.1 ABC-type branched-subunit amino acid transport system ATPase component/ABC-type branched-subunit amino acid transport system permease subunit [Beijerinckia sp. GAS462]SED97364.1 amino acid/amide ABC transporter membrane protein 2, HAAT family /amino acid/amide ABC transporter ATP-binding protein 1, HAAT family [Beijerinckia sp. 28-YEA-48]
MSPSFRTIALAIFIAASLLLPILAPSGTLVVLAIYIGLASLVAIGLVLLTGVGGMTSFGQAAMMGIGAYATALVTTRLGWSPWLALPIALIATGGISTLLGLLTIRLSGHFLPLGTIAWALALYYLYGALPFLGGYDGLSGIPALTFGPFDLSTPRAFYPLVWITVVLAVVATSNLLDSRPGRIIRTLRSGSSAVEAFGATTWRLRLFVFVYAGVLAGLAGWLFALFQRAVSASPFGLNAGLEYLLMAVIGGAGHIGGAIFGAAVVVLSRNVFQDILPLVFGQTSNFQAIAFGLLLVMLLQWAPDGVWRPLSRWFVRHRNTLPRRSDILPKAEQPERGSRLLSVEGLQKRFGGLVAVNQVDFAIDAGEIVGLIGPNGAGKSTTFNLITGLQRASGGRVRLAGRTISGLPSRRIARLRVARTFQHVKLVPSMSVLDNVAIGAHLRSHSGVLQALLRLDRTEEARVFAEAMRALERVGLAERAGDETGSLALGQLRIVEIARALCMDPVLLLLDEPAAGLRHHEKAALATLLKALAQSGVTILIVEHDMEFVMNLCDRLVVLNFGSKLADGLPEAVRTDPQVLIAYMGAA